MMKLTNIFLKVKQKNLIENTTTIMASGLANVIGSNEIHYQEKEEPFCKVIVLWNQEEITIKRYGEVKTTVHCRMNQDSLILAESEWGCLQIEIQTNQVLIEEKRILVNYDIMQEDEVMESFEIEWEFGGGHHESN